MVKRVPTLVSLCALVGALLLTVGGSALAAAAPEFTITADRASAVPAGHKWAFNDFFPRTATIATGGTFDFASEGFHTATLLPASWTAAADNDVNGAVAADIDDLTLNPNGTTRSVFNIPGILNVPAQGCGTQATPCVFDGTSAVSLGAPLLGPPAPLFVTVTAAPGTYVFHCRVHPHMEGALTVVAAGSSGTTTAAQADAAAAAQAAQDVADGLAAEAAYAKAGVRTNANGTKTWTLAVGTSDPAGHVAVLDMLPRKITIRSGDTVVWRPTDRNEPHTVTFPKDLGTEVLPMCEGPGGIDTPAQPTVIPPMSPFDFACGNGPPDEFENDGGNGVTVVTSPATVSDSGIVAYRSVGAGFDMPVTGARSSWYVRFTGAKAGTYHYVCQIHDGMEGTIVVH